MSNLKKNIDTKEKAKKWYQDLGKSIKTI
jgi:hypothetical protein